LSNNRFSIPTGHLAEDANIRQGFASTEKGLLILNESMKDREEEIENLKTDISNHFLSSISGLVASSSSTQDIVNALTTFSKKLKEL
tara:strand:+ start:104 stop:364 length:261 start_codon:yes stop_codon:yes gene_type:complete